MTLPARSSRPGSPGADARAGRLTLRRAVLAASVLDDIDLEPRDDGVRLIEPAPLTVPWPELARAVNDLDEDHPDVPARVSGWLRTRLVLAHLGATELSQRARPLGHPVVGRHDDPEPGWVRAHVLGGALRLGLGYLGVGPDPDRVDRLVDEALVAGGASPHAWWPEAITYLERMGAIAAERLPRMSLPSARTATTSAVLRPIGGCDVVTLLGSRTLRTALADADGTGMRAIAVPMRSRGWLDLRAIDPAFAPAAAAATAPRERGFVRPVLVTADEVRLAPHVDGASLAEIVLRDPAPTGFHPFR